MEYFKKVQLFGRCQKIASNITIDVGHNPLAARVILNEFLNQNKTITLIYNSLSDKDYKRVLTLLKPIVNEVLILDIEDKRAVEKKTLFDICNELNLPVETFSHIKKNKEYLVFGSFTVVEKFLKTVMLHEK